MLYFIDWPREVVNMGYKQWVFLVVLYVVYQLHNNLEGELHGKENNGRKRLEATQEYNQE